MIFVGLGANLPSPVFGPPVMALQAAVSELERAGCTVVRRSSWYESAPVPDRGQPWFVNGVVRIDTDQPPAELLAGLHRIEDRMGRVRTVPNADRVVDLDLLAYGEMVLDEPSGPVVPHPRLAERAFVLLPLREIAPDWVDPRGGLTVDALIRRLVPGQICRPLNPDAA